MPQFHQVNVFAENSMLGNPLAVVSCPNETPKDEQMLQFAKWTNLSETTFLLPPKTPGADYLVRIWTPVGEMPFAGHPTLGTAHVWLEQRGDQPAPSKIIQECGIGAVTVRKSDNLLSFKAPKCKFRPIADETLDQLLVAVGLNRDDVLDSKVLENGSTFHALLLKSSHLVASVAHEWQKFPKIGKCGLCAIRPDGDLEVRMLEINRQIEDPITGSLNAALAAWLHHNGTLARSYTAHQGLNIGRDGVVKVEHHDGNIWIGGAVQTVIKGNVELN